MNDLRDLYQEVILDHNRRPRNFGPLPNANRRAEGHNPLCGDRVTVYLNVADGHIGAVRFEGSGCAISTASASLMTEALKGLTLEDARDLFKGFHDLVTLGAGEGSPDLGKLAVFTGVREYPMRVKCATLAWHALMAALDAQDLPVTTE
ncbi:MAG TPA: SUF system NifU family Fe-S cluster assembly protein [Thermoanaerobaculia bacterium]|jgi:nitrogen fixation NifU-like protein|nr:SUF system NifU family Fe-S cluster assembly protein [Thermoanaerobaculia bacterium]